MPRTSEGLLPGPELLVFLSCGRKAEGHVLLRFYFLPVCYKAGSSEKGTSTEKITPLDWPSGSVWGIFFINDAVGELLHPQESLHSSLKHNRYSFGFFCFAFSVCLCIVILLFHSHHGYALSCAYRRLGLLGLTCLISPTFLPQCNSLLFCFFHDRNSLYSSR